MSQVGYTPISIYYSSTSTNVPLAANLVAGELAINTADGKLFYKDSSGVVQTIATKGGVNGTSNGQVLFNSSGSIGGSNNLFWDNSNGNLGIGTSSPATRLDIKPAQYSGGTALSSAINVNYNATSSSSNTSQGALTWQSGAYQVAAINPLFENPSVSYNTAMAFYTSNSTGTNTERMRINSSGNVLIGTGTSDNTNKLQVEGRIGATGFANTNGSYAALTASILNGYPTLGFAQYLTVENAASNSYGMAIYTTSAGTQAERMRIDSGGNVGIGTSSPDSRLHVVGANTGTGASSIRVGYGGASTNYYDADTHYIRIGSGGAIQVLTGSTQVFFTNNTESMRIDSSGNLLIGTSSVIAGNVCVKSGNIGQSFFRTDTTAFSPLAFYSNTSTLQGYITCTGAGATSYVTTSDQRLKENITDASNSLSIINSIKVRSFDWKESKVHQDFGFIAQELIEIVPDAVAVNQDDFKTMGVDASKLVPYLVKAMQEQQSIINELKSRIETLENK